MRELTKNQKIAIIGGVAAISIGIPTAYFLYNHLFPPSEGCVSNADCTTGYECVEGLCKKEATIKPQCSVDDECLSGFQCVGGKCVYVKPEFVTVSGTVMELREGLIYAPVPNANIAATNKDTNEKYSAISDSNGGYVLENMLPGFYEMTTSKNGYCSYTIYYLDWTYPGSWDYGYMNNAIRKMSLKTFTVDQSGVEWVSDREAGLGHNEDSIFVKGNCDVEYWKRTCTGSCKYPSDWKWGTSTIMNCEDGLKLKAWDDCPWVGDCTYYRPYLKIIGCEG